MSQRPLTDRQRKTLRRFSDSHPSRTNDDGFVSISPDVARQLIKRGLLWKFGTHERKEWNRTVAVLWTCALTEAGRSALDEIEAELALEALKGDR